MYSSLLQYLAGVKILIEIAGYFPKEHNPNKNIVQPKILIIQENFVGKVSIALVFISV